MTAFPVSVADLSIDPHPTLHRLRAEHPVVWIEPLDAWFVVSHELCTQVMLDPDTFTVDDPRFSTGQVIGPSMLSLDGPEHRRHRDPFAPPFRAAQIRELEDYARDLGRGLVDSAMENGVADLRADVAAPLAVAVMARVLNLHDVDVAEVLGWYEAIVDAVHVVTAGGEVPERGLAAFDDLKTAVGKSISTGSLLGSVQERGSLTVDEIASNVAVLLFGGIVTTESSAAIAFRYLLEDPDLMAKVGSDRSLLRPFVEETFRLEPSAAAVDRYATRNVDIGDTEIAAGDLVRVSLSAANRDPDVFDDPDRFEIHRDNHARTLTFARGPHACLGIHLARLETAIAVDALLDYREPVVAGELDEVTGLVFRVPETVMAAVS